MQWNLTAKGLAACNRRRQALFCLQPDCGFSAEHDGRKTVAFVICRRTGSYSRRSFRSSAPWLDVSLRLNNQHKASEKVTLFSSIWPSWSTWRRVCKTRHRSGRHKSYYAHRIHLRKWWPREGPVTGPLLFARILHCLLWRNSQLDGSEDGLHYRCKFWKHSVSQENVLPNRFDSGAISFFLFDPCATHLNHIP